MKRIVIYTAAVLLALTSCTSDKEDFAPAVESPLVQNLQTYGTLLLQ